MRRSALVQILIGLVTVAAVIGAFASFQRKRFVSLTAGRLVDNGALDDGPRVDRENEVVEPVTSRVATHREEGEAQRAVLDLERDA